MEAQPAQLIEGVVDRYKGLEIVDLSSLNNDEALFDVQLAQNLGLWKEQGIRSV